MEPLRLAGHPPAVWRHIGTAIALPISVLVLVPAVVLWVGPPHRSAWSLTEPLRQLLLTGGGGAAGLGVVLVVATVRMHATSLR
jgi:hypothetical protein